MRPRNITRKSRPASVHVTGITIGITQENNNGALHPRRRVDTSQERKSNSSANGGGTPSGPTRKPEPKKLLTGKVSPSHAASSPSSVTQPGETGTIKRPVKKTTSGPKDKSATAVGEVKNVKLNSTSAKPISTEKGENQIPKDGVVSASPLPVAVVVPQEAEMEAPSVVVVPEAFANTNPFSNPFESDTSVVENSNVSLEQEFNNLNNENELMTKQGENVEINNTKNESNVRVGGGNQKVIENFESFGNSVSETLRKISQLYF